MSKALSRGEASPFHIPDFRKWFTAETLLSISMGTQLAISLVLIDVSKSLSVAGFVSSGIAVVQLAAGVLGGVYADHVGRKVMIQRCVLASIFSIVALIVLLLGHLLQWYPATGVLVAGIAICAMAVAGSEAFAHPALDAALKELITPAQFPRAMSAAEARSAVISLSSRPATGALYSVTPLLPFVLRVVCDSGFLLLLGRIKRSFEPPREEGAPEKLRPRSIISSYKSGMRHVFADPVIRMVVVAAPLVNLMVFTGMMWVVFGMRDAGESALVIGVVSAAFPIGSLLGATVTPFLTDRVPSGWLAALGLSWMAVWFFLIFHLGDNYHLLFVAAVLAMVPSPAIGSALFAHVFHRTPSALQGRTLGSFTLFNGSVTIVAPLLASAAITRDASSVLGATLTALGLVGIACLLLSPSVRRLPGLKKL